MFVRKPARFTLDPMAVAAILSFYLYGVIVHAEGSKEPIPAIPIAQVSRMIHPPIDADTVDRFGCAVEAKGRFILVGNDGRRDGPPAAGMVTVHEPRNGRFIEAHRLRSPRSGPGDEFGAVLAMDGTLLVIGAPGMLEERGGAWAYRQAGDQWIPIGVISIPDAEPGDRFGEAITVGGGLILIGGPRADVGPILDRGRVVVFQVEGDVANRMGELHPPQDATGLRFGTSIAVGQRIEVGSPGLDAPAPPEEDEPIDRAGGVFAYSITAPHRFVEVLRRPRPDRLDRAGQSVVVASNRVVMSAPRATLGARRSGVITVFDHPPRESGISSAEEAGLGTTLAANAGFLAATIPGRRDRTGRIDPAVRLGVVGAEGDRGNQGFRPSVDFTGLGRAGGLQRIAFDETGEYLAIGVLPPGDGIPSAGFVHVVQMRWPDRPMPVQPP